VVLTVDQHQLGTSEEAWKSASQLRGLAPLDVPQPRRVVIVAPHPDDEILGVGGFLQHMGARKTPVEVVAVTDGEASHPLAAAQGLDLRAMRAEESARAFQRLRTPAPRVTRLGLPDGRVASQGDQLAQWLRSYLRHGDLCIAPWWHDGHPDHDACGAAALVATSAVRADLLGYLIWAWHWADPRGGDLPWDQCRRFDFDRRTAARKRWATRAFVSQTQPLGPDHDDTPLLPPQVVRRFWRSYEVFVTAPEGAL
jgi:LmbE family N-acetylglucosaminyl deacetylase